MLGGEITQSIAGGGRESPFGIMKTSRQLLSSAGARLQWSIHEMLQSESLTAWRESYVRCRWLVPSACWRVSLRVASLARAAVTRPEWQGIGEEPMSVHRASALAAAPAHGDVSAKLSRNSVVLVCVVCEAVDFDMKSNARALALLHSMAVANFWAVRA